MQWIATIRSWLPPMPSTPPRHSPHRTTLLQLAAIIAVALIMHLQIADLWIGGFAIVVFSVKVIALLRNSGPPNKFLLVLLTIFSLGLVVVLYGGWNGQRAGISFLVLLLTLKFLESEALRDYFVVCLILYFLAASSFLFDSSIFSILIVTAFTLAITAILFQISNPTQQSLGSSIKQSTGIVLRALPLAILIFFLFPRVHGSFGFIPSLDKSNDSGLADALVAGEMAASAFNQELAFRVNFEGGAIPARRDLYWRVKTMFTELNFTWEVGKSFSQTDLNTTAAMQSLASLKQSDDGASYRYTILHERTPDELLPYLDFVAGSDVGKIRYDYSVRHRPTGSRSFTYQGRSTLQPSLTTAETPISRSQNLNTTSQPSARTLAFLDEIRNQANSDSEVVNLVFDYIANSQFEYSLEPPLLDENDPVGDFLFNTKSGYCEHYASAFTLLMRWLGVPARIVVGYQGGEIINAEGANPFLELRYSDAHAWSEVWLNGQWQRVDPTLAVSSERIDIGMRAIQDLWDQGLLGSGYRGNALSDYLNPSGSAKAWLKFRDAWKSAAFQWNKWVVNYDADTQLELLKKLGFNNANHLLTLLLLLVGGTMVLMLLYFIRLMPKAVHYSPEQALYLKFVKRFRKLGIDKEIAETPAEFAQKAVNKAPWHQADIEAITKAYVAIRYGGANTDEQIDRFKKRIQRFRIKAS